MITALLNALTENKDDPNLRAVVISAEGAVFSAGHNLKELVGNC